MIGIDVIPTIYLLIMTTIISFDLFITGFRIGTTIHIILRFQ